MSINIIKLPNLKECPFCHEPAVLFQDSLYNNGHGYYGKYLYYVGCNNTNCSVKPKTQSIDDIYRDSEIAIQESIDRWNKR